MVYHRILPLWCLFCQINRVGFVQHFWWKSLEHLPKMWVGFANFLHPLSYLSSKMITIVMSFVFLYNSFSFKITYLKFLNSQLDVALVIEKELLDSLILVHCISQVALFKALSNVSNNALKSTGSRLFWCEELETKGLINEELKPFFYTYAFVHLCLMLTIKCNKNIFLHSINIQQSCFFTVKVRVYINLC